MRLPRAVFGIVLSLLSALISVSPVLAQEQPEGSATAAPLLVRAVDATDPAQPTLQLMYGGSDLSGLRLSQDGKEIPIGDPVQLGPAGIDLGVVFVVDTGASMSESGGLVAARESIASAVSNLASNQEAAVFAAGDSSLAVTDLSSSVDRVVRAAEGLAPSEQGGAAVWTSIRSAAELLMRSGSLQPNIVVVTSGVNVTDFAERDRALGQVRASGAAVFFLGVGGFDPAPWQELVQVAGGSSQVLGSVEDLRTAIADVQTWLTSDQYLVPFGSDRVPEDGKSELVETRLSVDDVTTDFAYITGRFQQGASALRPVEESPRGLLEVPFLQGSLGRILGVALVLVAVAMAVYSLAVIFGRDDSALSNVLQPYSEDFQVGAEDEEEESSALARMALVKRAVSLTEQVAQSQGYLSRTEAALERADLPLRAGEALTFYVGVLAVVAILALLLLPPMGAVVLLLVGALVPPAIVSFLAAQRRRKFEALLPDTLQMLSGTLRAGYSLMQGVEAVSHEVSEPMGKELRRVVTEARLGRPLEDALESMAERMASGDFAWAVMAINIQREVGGNLSELLMTVADTMIQRERLRRDIAALTAEGRMSAIVLGILPIGLGVVMFVINPEYMGRLFDDTLGNILLGLAILGMGVGFAWMRKIITIDI